MLVTAGINFSFVKTSGNGTYLRSMTFKLAEVCAKKEHRKVQTHVHAPGRN